MSERVQCDECQEHYDSDEHPFCPRCGALDRTEGDLTGPAWALVDRNDPRRRRVQAAGIMLLLVGGLTATLFIAVAAMAPALVPQTMDAIASEPGGDLQVRILESGEPLSGLLVDVWTLNGTHLAQEETDEAGWANFTGLQQAGVNVTVEHGGTQWQRNILTMAGVEAGSGGPQMELDLATDPPSIAGWLGINAFVTSARVLAATFAAVSAVVVAGGVAAVRRRKYNLAFAGALVGALPWLILFVASLNLLVFLVLGLFVLSAVLLFRGRPVFQD